MRRTGSEAVGNGHHRLLRPGTGHLVRQLGHPIDAAARTIDVDQDLTDRVIRQRLAQHRRKLLRADAARPRHVVDHVATLSDDAIQGQDGDPTAGDRGGRLPARFAHRAVGSD